MDPQPPLNASGRARRFRSVIEKSVARLSVMILRVHGHRRLLRVDRARKANNWVSEADKPIEPTSGCIA
jgi:hypothetical protein